MLPDDELPVPPPELYFREISRRIRRLRVLNLTPFQVELGKEEMARTGNPLSVLGYPVVPIPLPSYFRVAYEEWAYERLPE